MVCHLCGCTTLTNFHEFKAHMKTIHAVHVANKFPPKAVTVARWEARNARLLIDPTRVACPATCRCDRCFQIALDALVESSREAANASGADSRVNDELERD